MALVGPPGRFEYEILRAQVQAIAHAHGGLAVADPVNPDGAIFEIHLPELLAELYAKYCQRFEAVIAEKSPQMPEAIRKKRAVLIAFPVEGIMIHLNINSGLRHWRR